MRLFILSLVLLMTLSLKLGKNVIHSPKWLVVQSEVPYKFMPTHSAVSVFYCLINSFSFEVVSELNRGPGKASHVIILGRFN